MFSFLLQINNIGAIEQVIWSDPIDFISGDCTSIFQLFSKDAKSVLMKTIKKSTDSQDAFFCDSAPRLRDYPANMSLCISSTKKKYLVFASEYQAGWDNESIIGYQSTIMMFMNIIKNAVNKPSASVGTLPDESQSEMIQTLLGELRTRKQMLEEVNTKLNTTNADLSNRLVKDTLTGLVSRYQYRAEMELMISRHPGKLGIFVFLDIDDFKKVNDKYGHALGDGYLIEFAERLKRLPVEDMVAMRISGDEFGLFVFGLEDCNRAVMDHLWHMIKAHVLSAPIVANGRSLPISVSAGMSVYGRDTTEIYELIEYADHAMYTAKRKGKNHYTIYSK